MYEFVSYKVRHVMTKDPMTLRVDTPLSEAGSLFDRHDFNAMPVIDVDRALVGWVSKLDFLEAFAVASQSVMPRYAEILAKPVESVMRQGIITTDPETPLTSILGQMVASRHKSFPVLDGDRLVGVVAREDVLRAIRKAAAGERPQG